MLDATHVWSRIHGYLLAMWSVALLWLLHSFQEHYLLPSSFVRTEHGIKKLEEEEEGKKKHKKHKKKTDQTTSGSEAEEVASGPDEP